MLMLLCSVRSEKKKKVFLQQKALFYGPMLRSSGKSISEKTVIIYCRLDGVLSTKINKE
jgi:hypothetical protein